MSLTINAKTYTADSFQKDQVGYNGPSNSVTVSDSVVLKRTAPKPTDVFSGLSRTSCKATRTLTLTGAKTTTGNAILEISISVPVGAAAADVDTLLNDFGSFLASASYKTHVKTPQVAF